MAVCEDGRVRHVGQISTTPEALSLFAGSLAPSDEVAIEAIRNPHAIARLLEPRGPGWWSRTLRRRGRSPRPRSRPTRSTPRWWHACLPPTTCRRCGRPTMRRTRPALRSGAAHIVRQRTRLKNQAQSILHRNLVPRCPAADLFGRKGRAWLQEQELPADERRGTATLKAAPERDHTAPPPRSTRTDFQQARSFDRDQWKTTLRPGADCRGKRHSHRRLSLAAAARRLRRAG
jgi:transposase